VHPIVASQRGAVVKAGFMLKTWKNIVSSTTEYPTQRDVFRGLVTAIQTAENGGLIILWERQVYWERWARVSACHNQKSISLEFRAAKIRDSAQSISLVDGIFHPYFHFARFNAHMGTAIWKCAQALTPSFVEEIMNILDRLFIDFYEIGPPDIVEGRVEYYLRKEEQIENPLKWEKADAPWQAELPTYSLRRCSIDELPVQDKSSLESNPDVYYEEWVWQTYEYVGRDGSTRQGFVGNGLIFDRITKLTYKHFLCKQDSVYTFYYSIDERSLTPAVRITLVEEPTFEQVLKVLQEAYPQVYQSLSEHLQKVPGRDAYISDYRNFVSDYSGDPSGFDHCILHVAYEQVIIDNHFRVTSPGTM
jgi:hypothetical protein